jgi:hypothetical protein
MVRYREECINMAHKKISLGAPPCHSTPFHSTDSCFIEKFGTGFRMLGFLIGKAEHPLEEQYTNTQI